MVAREDFIKKYPEVIKDFVQGWLEGTEEANRKPDLAVKLLMDNEPLYKELGEKATRDGLNTVKWANLADNTQMFGLDGSEPMFDRIFKQASEAWIKRGYISQAVVPAEAKDDSFLRQVYQAAAVKPEKPDDRGFKPDPNAGTKPAIVTKPVKIEFASGNAEVSGGFKQILDQVASLAQSYSNASIRIEGNTDNVGNPESNRQLSERRAQAVVAYLTSTYKFNPARFLAKGNGDKNPIASNATADGRQRNRRTDVEIVPK
jgi:NitT/TauT family transport system substrate-binding protein